MSTVNGILLGKDRAVRLCFACILARGHLLIEDVPGVGKTTLAQTLAHALGLEYRRVQFTSDLLPADILGASVWHRDSGEFRFQPGPIFSQLILADEVNRATPKTQSALLEAMEEHQVTIDGATRHLPEPFFVIATQNPHYQIGTFPLPESQLDRFLMRIELGYPDASAERELLEGRSRREMLAELAPAMSARELVAVQQRVDQVFTSVALLDYIQAIVRYTRESPDFVSGLSPRAALALKRAAQAWALLDNRDAVIPEDVQAVLEGVISHRLQPRRAEPGATEEGVAQRVIEAVPVP
ncbi:MAG TPA: AAA family ATPase [Gammaproteobacteria bacterium]|nr:AAA family ATPase [Gammaproteobacteria bacterium]